MGHIRFKIKVGSGTNLYLPTGISVHKSDWNDDLQRSTAKNAYAINNTLSLMITNTSMRMLELIDSGQFGTLDRKRLKALLMDMDADPQEVSARNDMSIGAIFERVIKQKNDRNAEIYQSTLDKLKAYCDIYSLTFDDISKSWLNDFEARHRHLAVNTLAIHLRNLRSVNNFAIDENITQNYPFRKHRIRSEETEKRSLPIETMRYYINATGLTPALREHRDMFILMFYLIGINAVDMVAPDGRKLREWTDQVSPGQDRETL